MIVNSTFFWANVLWQVNKKNPHAMISLTVIPTSNMFAKLTKESVKENKIRLEPNQIDLYNLQMLVPFEEKISILSIIFLTNRMPTPPLRFDRIISSSSGPVYAFMSKEV